MLNIDIKNHRPLREIVYEELKKEILRGKITPGTRIMEVEMAEQLGVSRTPIREAIRKLEKEGLVTIEPRRGAYASRLSQDDMKEIVEVRKNLESFVTRYAARRITSSQINLLHKVCAKFDEAVAEGNTADMIKYDTEFHHRIAEASGNSLMLQMMEILQQMVLRFRYLYFNDFRRGEKMPIEHHRIMDALEAHDEEAAAKEVYFHIERLTDDIYIEDDGTMEEDDVEEGTTADEQTEQTAVEIDSADSAVSAL